MIKKSLPKVTSTQTILDAMNSNGVFKEMLPPVHQLLRLFMTIPVSSATSERYFSAMAGAEKSFKSGGLDCKSKPEGQRLNTNANVLSRICSYSLEFYFF